ncbi:hypothetical protein [Micromonospora sp. NPDC050695]|uniref:hypothetical protein n=1 Tax=Micromonospora sp. NPDC050695 TaxID=3154938 RepID=UPI0033EFFE9F
MTDDGEVVVPWRLTGLQRVRRWQFGHSSGFGSRHVTLGHTADGRWLAEDSDTARGSRAYRTRERAERALAELMWDGEWHEAPAVLDANGQADGWVRCGGTWVRGSEDAAEDR